MISLMNIVCLVSVFSCALAEVTFDYINSVCGEEMPNSNTTKYPWTIMVLKNSEEDDKLKFGCGGNLISTRTVIAAAHCFHFPKDDINKPEKFSVSMGGKNSTKYKDSLRFAVEKIIIHPNYKFSFRNRKGDNDLAIVHLKQGVDFSTTSFRPICLWQGSSETSETHGLIGLVSGFKVQDSPPETFNPTTVDIRTFSDTKCNEIFDDGNNYKRGETSLNATRRTLCVELLDSRHKLDFGSGSGLMMKNDNKWMLRGTAVLSLGDQYDIFVDNAKFDDWIRSNMLL